MFYRIPMRKGKTFCLHFAEIPFPSNIFECKTKVPKNLNFKEQKMCTLFSNVGSLIVERKLQGSHAESIFILRFLFTLRPANYSGKQRF